MTTTKPLTLLSLDDLEFERQYPLVPNPFDDNASWQTDEGAFMFETFGEEHEFVRQQNPRHIWTLVDEGEHDGYLVISGYHWVNRIGYLISTQPWPKGTETVVRIDSERGDE